MCHSVCHSVCHCEPMNGIERQSKTGKPVTCPETAAPPKPRKAVPFFKVLDARNQPIRGLWKRNDRFYARLTVDDPHSKRRQVRRVPLPNAKTVAQARDALNELLNQRVKGTLPSTREAPTFTVYADGYLQHFEGMPGAKAERTLECERGHINLWKDHLGKTRLNAITKTDIAAFIAKRQKAGISARTVNLSVTVLRNVLKKAIDDGWLTILPTANLRPLKHTKRKRQLVTPDQIEALCTTALHAVVTVHSRRKQQVREGDPKAVPHPLQNGRQLADYIKLMGFCGARKSETLRLRWPDVDWTRRQLTIGADGATKNREHRVVDFNPELEAHLRDMQTRRAPDSEWLFPSPQRGETDRAAKTFTESLRIVRKLVGLPNFGFHDCRHFFISYCVMAGIDYMTIAKWVGHKDGGVLIGKVYGHLADEHAKQQASRLRFGVPKPSQGRTG